MKERMSRKIIEGYERKIRKTTSEYDIRGIMIEVSKRCSAYELSWAEFLVIRKAIQEHGRKIGVLIR